VVSDLGAVLTRAGAEVTHDPLPIVKADPTQFGRVLQNLIENAVKYRGTAPPRVHVSARADNGEWIFSVQDNGIGIDPKHYDQIFCMFGRLHGGDSPYAGVGIGLAVCKKIIERHG